MVRGGVFAFGRGVGFGFLDRRVDGVEQGAAAFEEYLRVVGGAGPRVGIIQVGRHGGPAFVAGQEVDAGGEGEPACLS